MRNSNSLRIIGGVAVAALLTASQAGADIAYNYSSTLAGNQPSRTWAFGNVFTVTTPVNINQLGAFDNGRDGIGGTGLDVAIYSITLSGTAITGGSLVVPSYLFLGTADSLLAGTSTRVHDLSSPVTLGAGTYMVVANHYGSTGDGAAEQSYNPYWTDPSPNGANLASANPAFGVTFGGGYWSLDQSSFASFSGNNGGWNYDTAYKGSPASPRYGAGNFDFSPVPEAAQFAMAGVGLLGLVYVGRNAWLRRRLNPA